MGGPPLARVGMRRCPIGGNIRVRSWWERASNGGRGIKQQEYRLWRKTCKDPALYSEEMSWRMGDLTIVSKGPLSPHCWKWTLGRQEWQRYPSGGYCSSPGMMLMAWARVSAVEKWSDSLSFGIGWGIWSSEKARTWVHGTRWNLLGREGTEWREVVSALSPGASWLSESWREGAHKGNTFGEVWGQPGARMS